MKVVERARLLVNVVYREVSAVGECGRDSLLERDQPLVKMVDRDQRLLVVERA